MLWPWRLPWYSDTPPASFSPAGTPTCEQEMRPSPVLPPKGDVQPAPLLQHSVPS